VDACDKVERNHYRHLCSESHNLPDYFLVWLECMLYLYDYARILLRKLGADTPALGTRTPSLLNRLECSPHLSHDERDLLENPGVDASAVPVLSHR